VAAHATREGERLRLRGLLADPDGTNLRRGEREAAFPKDEAEAARLGRDLGVELKKKGAPAA
jgi:hydroxymethylbilane synthase